MIYSCSGSPGDCIFALPFLRGSTLCLYPNHNVPWTLRKPQVDSLMPLLKSQGVNCIWRSSGVGQSLEGWRDWLGNGLNIQSMFASHLQVAIPDPSKKFIFVQPSKVGQVIFSRSFRYRNPGTDYRPLFDLHKHNAIFVGHIEEYRDWVSSVGYLPYYPTNTLLDLAEVIEGSELVICNQSAISAISEGCKKRMILETCPEPRLDTCRYKRDNLHYGNAHIHSNKQVE